MHIYNDFNECKPLNKHATVNQKSKLLILSCFNIYALQKFPILVKLDMQSAV